MNAEELRRATAAAAAQSRVQLTPPSSPTNHSVVVGVNSDASPPHETSSGLKSVVTIINNNSTVVNNSIDQSQVDIDDLKTPTVEELSFPGQKASVKIPYRISNHLLTCLNCRSKMGQVRLAPDR